MTSFSSFEDLWAYCQPALEGGARLYVEKAGERREFSTRRELSILDSWAGGATIVSGGAERAALFKAELPPVIKENARAVFLAGTPNRIEVLRGVPLAGEGRRLFRKSIPGAGRSAGGGPHDSRSGLPEPLPPGLPGARDTYSEKDLEAAILRELERFLLELGTDFSFIARQKRMTIGDRDFYLDLLFYHRSLRRWWP